MSMRDKINEAQPTSWLTDGIPKWKVKLIIRWAKIRARIVRFLIDLRKEDK